jgi:hypothetical protein
MEKEKNELELLNSVMDQLNRLKDLLQELGLRKSLIATNLMESIRNKIQQEVNKAVIRDIINNIPDHSIYTFYTKCPEDSSETQTEWYGYLRSYIFSLKEQKPRNTKCEDGFCPEAYIITNPETVKTLSLIYSDFKYRNIDTKNIAMSSFIDYATTTLYKFYVSTSVPSDIVIVTVEDPKELSAGTYTKGLYGYVKIIDAQPARLEDVQPALLW